MVKRCNEEFDRYEITLAELQDELKGAEYDSYGEMCYDLEDRDYIIVDDDGESCCYFTTPQTSTKYCLHYSCDEWGCFVDDVEEIGKLDPHDMRKWVDTEVDFDNDFEESLIIRRRNR